MRSITRIPVIHAIFLEVSQNQGYPLRDPCKKGLWYVGVYIRSLHLGEVPVLLLIHAIMITFSNSITPAIVRFLACLVLPTENHMEKTMEPGMKATTGV